MNRLEELLRNDRPAIGTWLSLGSPRVADVLGHGGFDWLLVDGQHSPIGPMEMSDLARVALASGASPVVRVAGLEAGALNQALDAGAHAVMVPSVSTAEDAQLVVNLATYPPKGRRSVGGYGAHHAFGLSRADYLAAAAPSLVVIQIEDRHAVERIEQILEVEGIDVCFIGPQDLAASLGLTPQLDSRERPYLMALETISTAAVRRGVRLGVLTATVESAIWHLERGFRMVAVATDVRLLEASAREVVLPLADWSNKL